MVIYFGPKEDFENGGKAEAVKILAINDRFKFDQGVGIFQTHDPECFKDYQDVDTSKEFLIFFNGEN